MSAKCPHSTSSEIPASYSKSAQSPYRFNLLLSASERRSWSLFSVQNKPPAEKLKISVSSSSPFMNGVAIENRIGTGPNHCGIMI